MSQELISFVKTLTKNKKKKEIPSILKNNGFKQIGQGAYKKVFYHKNWPNFVVKVYKPHKEMIEDSFIPLPKEIRKFWLRPTYRNKKLLIQPKVKKRYAETAYDMINLFAPDNIDPWCFDIHPDNCGFYKEKPVIFDYCSWSQLY